MSGPSCSLGSVTAWAPDPTPYARTGRGARAGRRRRHSHMARDGDPAAGACCAGARGTAATDGACGRVWGCHHLGIEILAGLAQLQLCLLQHLLLCLGPLQHAAGQCSDPVRRAQGMRKAGCLCTWLPTLRVIPPCGRRDSRLSAGCTGSWYRACSALSGAGARKCRWALMVQKPLWSGAFL
jgi:hypothetical protein